MFTVTSMLTHNLGRELQMSAEPQSLRDSMNRAARWAFRKLDTLRHVILRAGRLTRPEGSNAGSTLVSLGMNSCIGIDIIRYFELRRNRLTEPASIINWIA
jgi:hypothetical protein